MSLCKLAIAHSFSELAGLCSGEDFKVRRFKFLADLICLSRYCQNTPDECHSVRRKAARNQLETPGPIELAVGFKLQHRQEFLAIRRAFFARIVDASPEKCVGVRVRLQYSPAADAAMV